MLSMQIKVGEFHPAIISAIATALSLPENNNVVVGTVDKLQRRCEELLADSAEGTEDSSKIREKARTKKQDFWSLTLTGKIAGLAIPNTPAGWLIRIANYLEMSREFYLRVDAVQLPASVVAWAKSVAETVAKEEAEATAAEAKAKAEREEAPTISAMLIEGGRKGIA